MTVRCICYNITSDTLLASCYEARSILQVNISAMLCDKRTVCLEVPPPWQLTGINIAGRNAPRSKARFQREDNDATNLHAILHFKEWRRFTLCVLLYSAASRRGNPMPNNLTLLWFRVNKKNRKTTTLSNRKYYHAFGT